MSQAYTIIKDLYSLSRHISSPDYNKSILKLKKYLNFKTLNFTSKHNHNGWILPNNWYVKEASIFKGKKKILDGLEHPLMVISNSSSFEGYILGNKLKKKLYYDIRNENYIPFHFRQSYRPWINDWGFCVNKKFYKQLENKTLYKVVLKTKKNTPSIKILDYLIKGKTGTEFCFVAHLDHPGMANDDLSGCAVGIDLFTKLSKIKTKHSYRLLIVPEIIGSQYYLEYNKKPKEGIFLEMLGNDNKITLQSSFKKNSIIEREITNLLKKKGIEHNIKKFRETIQNDEAVFESFGCPMPLITRFPYKEYHSNYDNLSIISKTSLSKSTNILYETIRNIEKKIYIKNNFNGTPCLSNPKYNLYIDAIQLAFDKKSKNSSLRQVMDLIPILGESYFLEDILENSDIDYNTLISYIKLWSKKKLITIF